MVHNCYVCDSDEVGDHYTVREMQIGTRESFDYFSCKNCGALQIATIPDDLSKYYPKDYYSLSVEPFSKRWLKDQRLGYLCGKPNPVGWLLTRFKPRPQGHYWIPPELGMDASILDIGCVGGEFIEEAFLRGYRNLRGIDPFISDSSLRSSPFVIERKSVEELGAHEKFDLIIMNHSLEHMPDGNEMLGKIREHLNPSGTLCVRIPVQGDAWKKYGVHWVGIDAPRHIVIHLDESMHHAAELAGYAIYKSWRDSNAYHYFASLQYANDIPLMAKNSWYIDPKSSSITQEQVDKMEIEAQEANARNDGDQAVYWLKLN